MNQQEQVKNLFIYCEKLVLRWIINEYHGLKVLDKIESLYFDVQCWLEEQKVKRKIKAILKKIEELKEEEKNYYKQY